MPLSFEWDENKAKSNLAKHGVSFEDAIRIISARLASRRERKDYEENAQ